MTNQRGLPAYSARELFPKQVWQAVELTRRNDFPLACIPEVGRLLQLCAGLRGVEQICELEEYYLTRAEHEILQAHAAEIVGLGPLELVELGSGSAVKTRLFRARGIRPLQAAGCDQHRVGRPRRNPVDQRPEDPGSGRAPVGPGDPRGGPGGLPARAARALSADPRGASGRRGVAAATRPMITPQDLASCGRCRHCVDCGAPLRA